MTAALDPACDGGDAFVDALVGLSRMCGDLAGAIAESDQAIAGAGAADGAGTAAELDEPLAAVLGLISVRTTLSLVLAALCGEHAEAAPDPDAVWSREQLR